MALVKLLAIVAGPDFRGQPGETIELSQPDAIRLVAAGAATLCESAERPLAPAPAVESAPVEPAVAPAASGLDSLAGLSIAKVLAAVESGSITAARALELEQQSAKPRPSLVAQLTELVGAS